MRSWVLNYNHGEQNCIIYLVFNMCLQKIPFFCLYVFVSNATAMAYGERGTSAHPVWEQYLLQCAS